MSFRVSHHDDVPNIPRQEPIEDSKSSLLFAQRKRISNSLKTRYIRSDGTDSSETEANSTKKTANGLRLLRNMWGTKTFNDNEKMNDEIIDKTEKLGQGNALFNSLSKLTERAKESLKIFTKRTDKADSVSLSSEEIKYLSGNLVRILNSLDWNHAELKEFYTKNGSDPREFQLLAFQARGGMEGKDIDIEAVNVTVSSNVRNLAQATEQAIRLADYPQEKKDDLLRRLRQLSENIIKSCSDPEERIDNSTDVKEFMHIVNWHLASESKAQERLNEALTSLENINNIVNQLSTSNSGLSKPALDKKSHLTKQYVTLFKSLSDKKEKNNSLSVDEQVIFSRGDILRLNALKLKDSIAEYQENAHLLPANEEMWKVYELFDKIIALSKNGDDFLGNIINNSEELLKEHNYRKQQTFEPAEFQRVIQSQLTAMFGNTNPLKSKDLDLADNFTKQVNLYVSHLDHEKKDIMKEYTDAFNEFVALSKEIQDKYNLLEVNSIDSTQKEEFDIVSRDFLEKMQGLKDKLEQLATNIDANSQVGKAEILAFRYLQANINSAVKFMNQLSTESL